MKHTLPNPAASTTPPPQTRSASTRAIRVGCAIAICAAGTWAFWPLDKPGAVTSMVVDGRSSAPSPPTRTPTNPPRLDLVAFHAPLWVSPPSPSESAPPPPPPPPLKLQLVAIVGERGESMPRSALLYDPDQDKLLTLHQGDTISGVKGRIVDRITEQEVQIRDIAGVRTLALRSDHPSPVAPSPTSPRPAPTLGPASRTQALTPPPRTSPDDPSVPSGDEP